MSRARITAGVASLSLAMALAACDDGGKQFDRRSQIGAHYTDRAKIELLTEMAGRIRTRR